MADTEQNADDEVVADDAAKVETPEGAESAVLDEQTDSSTAKPVRFAAWGVGIFLALAVAWAAPWVQQLSGVEPFGYSYLPTLPLFVLIVLALIWNPIWYLVRIPGLALRGKEIILVACLVYVVAGVAAAGATKQWTGTIHHRDGAYRNFNPALPEKEGDPDLSVYRAYPESFSATPAAIARENGDEATLAMQNGLFDGGQPWSDFHKQLPSGEGGMASPFQKAVEPLVNSAPLLLIGFLLIFALIAFTAKQWTHHERLQHPLVQVPAALAEGVILRNRGFQVTLLVMVLFWLYQLGAGYGWHPLPAVATSPMIQVPDIYKLFGMGAAPGWPTNMMNNYWSAFHFLPFAIGIAFLLATDVGFSVWGGFFFGVIVTGWLYSAGVQVNFPTHGRLAGGGATIGMAILILWLGRIHYWQLLRAAFGLGPNPNDSLGVWGARLTILAMVCLAICLTVIFKSVMVAIIATLLAAAFLLVIARVVAESGLACFQAAHTLTAVTYATGLPLVLPLKAVLGLVWLAGTMIEDTRSNLAGYAVQSTALGERYGLKLKRVLMVAFGIVIAALAIAVYQTLKVNWTMPHDAPSSGNGPFGIKAAVTAISGEHRGGFLGLDTQQFAIVVGFVLIFAVAGLRRIWVACPLHPIGLVVAASWPIFIVWGSLALGWLLKILVLRYGGAALYKQMKPIAIALILGDALGFGLQMVFQIIGGINGVDWSPVRTWP